MKLWLGAQPPQQKGGGGDGAGAHYVTDLHVLEYHDCEDISGNISHPILKATVKYRNLETYKADKNLFEMIKRKSKFLFCKTNKVAL